MAQPPLHPEHPASDVVLATLRALAFSRGPHNAAFLAKHNIVVTNEADERAREQLDARRAFLVPANLPDYLHSCLRPLPFEDDRDSISWARRISSAAWTMTHYLTVDATSPMVCVNEPNIDDASQLALYEAWWDRTPFARAWKSTHVLLVGDRSGDHRHYRRQDVVGCVVPIRPDPEQAVSDQGTDSLHRAELFCALTLLLRQLKRNRPADFRIRLYPGFLAMKVTIVATTEDRIRIHEASFDGQTAPDSGSPIRVIKRLDLSLRDITGDEDTMCANGRTVGDNWLDVMSYMCFVDEKDFEPEQIYTYTESEPADAVTTEPACGSPTKAASLDAVTSEPVCDSPAKAAPTSRVQKSRTPLAEIPQPNANNTRAADKANSPKKKMSPVKAARAASREDCA
ncbi:hypothetical protein P171DRAFT_437679 [Karstenula rhodostoma CBS 690.94]|uniref:Uncharacterized protein n=1 Tax=Karstenula rhodostoma CBS 690.94 TaxID=1392251 RepID=A0A9P4P5I5_9PLEO|nr:hypothetical protein P171DRAFT_437679 [Karstenula rhodostoma CBS 690.94]